MQINIVIFKIIHVVVDFNENHHKIFGWILKRLGFIMDFWNDNTMFITQKNEKCGLKKYVKVMIFF
jgi:hypothetical protein